MELNINGKGVTFDAAPDMPLLWVLRDTLNMTGTKFGCGIAACGACTVHIDGEAVRSCVMPVSAVAGKKIRTIEALGTADKPRPTDADIDEAMTNICRCGTYQRVRAAIHRAAGNTAAITAAVGTGAAA